MEYRKQEVIQDEQDKHAQDISILRSYDCTMYAAAASYKLLGSQGD